MRTTIMGTGLSARLTGVGCATLAILASASVSACPAASPSATPTTFSPAGTGSATPHLPSGTASVTTPSASVSPSATPSRSASPSATPSPSASPLPTAAPTTGGGGTAGFQDALLFGLGGAAILAGAGSIAYGRKVIRNRSYTIRLGQLATFNQASSSYREHG